MLTQLSDKRNSFQAHAWAHRSLGRVVWSGTAPLSLGPFTTCLGL